ncbi:MAG: hypothetical protein KC441_08655 [Anaerolineales bacterium]|nr:hypothetical protein [Anaerolineales bacterium]
MTKRPFPPIYLAALNAKRPFSPNQSPNQETPNGRPLLTYIKHDLEIRAAPCL